MYVTQSKLHQSNNAFQRTHNPVDEEGTQKLIKVIKVHNAHKDHVNKKTADSYLFTVETERKVM